MFLIFTYDVLYTLPQHRYEVNAATNNAIPARH